MLAGDEAAPDSAAQPSACTLQRIELCGTVGRELVSVIGAYAQQLRELNFIDCDVVLRSGPGWRYSPLMSETGAPRLQHLTKLSLPKTWSYESCRELRLPGLEQACTTASQQLVAAYCAQLTWLDVPVRSAASLSSWCRLLFCRCVQLEQLRIVADLVDHDWTRQPQELLFEPAEAEDVLTLTGFKALTMERLPLTDSGLLPVLSRCPELEYCCLRQMTHVTQAGKEAALRCCPMVSGKRWSL